LEIDSNSLVAGSAAIAAWFATLFSYRSYIVSKKALLLAESENDARKSNITAYRADSFKIYDYKEKQHKYIFSIAYANKSEANDSITEVFLETHYVNSRNRVSYLISPHDEGSSHCLSGEAQPAKLPINIQARSSITNWFVFSIPTVVKEAKKTNKYRVVARNNSGEEVFVEAYILREIEYEKSS
jgi:hypothetical protein